MNFEVFLNKAGDFLDSEPDQRSIENHRRWHKDFKGELAALVDYFNREAPALRKFLGVLEGKLGGKATKGLTSVLTLIRSLNELDGETRLWFNQKAAFLTEEFCLDQARRFAEKPGEYIQGTKEAIGTSGDSIHKFVFDLYDVFDIEGVASVLALLELLRRVEKTDEGVPVV